VRTSYVRARPSGVVAASDGAMSVGVEEGEVMMPSFYERGL
jgi:hypothetical protein